MVAEGLFDQDRRLAVDRPDSLIDRVAGQTDARAHGERGRAYPFDALRVRGSNRDYDKEDSGGEQSFQRQERSMAGPAVDYRWTVIRKMLRHII